METNSFKDRIESIIERRSDQNVRILERLCNQPSVSARNDGIDECALVVAELLEEHGCSSEIMATDGHPVVYGEYNNGSDKTVLFYLHYDVQPPEPIDLWHSSPFELRERDGKLYARGAADDKGNIAARLAALAAVREALGDLPCNVKFLIEGEEEVGSPSLASFVENQRDKLMADGCIWETGGANDFGAPLQILGMRGILYVTLRVSTASRDAHSGLGGSIFPNAAWRLVWALNSLKDADERILIPGFYDDVAEPSARDLESLSAMKDDSEQLKSQYGLKGFLNDMSAGLELKQSATFMPTCTVCGLTSGYQGDSTKTVLPAAASAKIDFRLVPNQMPDRILARLRDHLDEQGFDDIEISTEASQPPARIDADHPFVELSSLAGEDAYGQPREILPMMGGSGPIHSFVHGLGLPVAFSGVGYSGSSVHAPNEHIRVSDFKKGILHTALIIERFANG